MKSKDARVAILHALKRLSESRDKEQFAAASTQFKKQHAEHPQVVSHYCRNWEPVAQHWAQFGRADRWDLQCNTNNFLERFMGLFKHTFCERKRSARLAQLIQTITSKVIPHYIRDRMKKEAGLINSRVTAIQAKHEHNVRFLVEGGLIRVRRRRLRLQ